MSKKRNSRRNVQRAVRRLLSFMVLALFMGIGLFAFQDVLVSMAFGNSLSADSQKEIETSSNQEEKYKQIIKGRDEIGKGNLILVNHSYSFKGELGEGVINLYCNKKADYQVSDRDVCIHETVLKPLDEMLEAFERAKDKTGIDIISGYRTREYQNKLLSDKVKKVGTTEALKWVAKPGESEHHTGYAVDFGINNSKGQSVSYTGTGAFGWINDNCGNYGFVKRYSGEKEELTGIANEPWHFRYVGRPHGNIMVEKGFCLEEYINFLKEYSFENEHLNYTDFDGQAYEIYYKKANRGKTKVPVPKTNKYLISGNNIDGFIVTVKIP